MPKTSNKTNQKEFLFKLSPIEPSIDAAWYVVNTYSGHEYKAIEALKTRIKTMGLEDHIFHGCQMFLCVFLQLQNFYLFET